MARPKLTKEQKELQKKKKLDLGKSQGKTLIDDVINKNSKLEEMFKIFQENNLEPVDENVKPDTDKQRFIEYYYDKINKEKANKELSDAIKANQIYDNLERIKENNKKYEKKQKINALNAIKDATTETGANILYGMGKGISGSGAGLIGLFQNLGNYAINKIKDPENTKFSEEIGKENVWNKSQQEFDDLLADILNVQDAWDSDNWEDKTQQFIGEFGIPQTYLKKPFELTAKLTKNSEKAQAALNFVIPGPQITKGATTKQQIAEIGGQLPVALGFEEGLSALGDKRGIIGDYREEVIENPNTIKDITLINDKRKIGKKLFIEDLDPETIRLIQLDTAPQVATWKQYSPFHNESGDVNGFGYTAMTAGSVLGASKLIRGYRKIQKAKADKLAEDIINSDNPLQQLDEITKPNKNELSGLMNTLNNDPRNVRKQLNSFEKLENSLVDRMNFINNMKQRGQLNNETLSEVSRDIYSQIEARFSSGILDDGIQTKISPLFTKQKIAALKAEQPEYYDKLERLLEISSIVQDETNRVNKFILNRQIGMTPDEYINARGAGKLNIKESINYRNTANLLDLQKEHSALLKELRSIPQTATIIDEISDINQQMLKVLEKSGMYSQRSIDIIKKNRQFNGLLSYKPRKEQIEETLKDKAINLLFNKQDNKARPSEIFNMRTEGSVGVGQNYLDLMEHDIKSTLLDIHNNALTKQFVEDALPLQNKSLNQVLDDAEVRINNLTNNKKLDQNEILSKKRNINKKVLAEVNDIMVVRPVGVEDLDELNTHAKPKSFFDIINREQKDTDWLSNSLNEIFGESEDKFSKASKNFQTRKDIITVRDKGKLYYYQVDPIIAKAFSSSPELPGLIGSGIKKLKDFRQQTITGKLNPAFSIPSAAYTTEENLIALGKITDELNIAFDKNLINRKDYLKEIKTAYNEIKTQEQSKLFMKYFNEEYIKNFGNDGLLDQKMFEVTQKTLQDNINSTLLSKIQLSGGASSKPFNVNTGIYYTLNKDTELGNKIKEIITKNNTLNAASKLINIIDYTQTALREAPNIGLVQYLGKQTGAIVDNKIVDNKKFDEILRAVSKYTANMGKRGSHHGLVGSLGKAVENYAPYGHVMLQSLAPKLKGLKVSSGLSNIKKNLFDLADPDVSYTEILSNIKNQVKSASGDKYVQSFVAASMIPAMMMYTWNYSNQENADAFHGISDYDKASKIVLANALGKNNHLFIPLDQELAVGYALSYNILDSLFGMSAINQNDPAFNKNKLAVEALSRSLFFDEIAGVDIGSAFLGKKTNVNPLDDRRGINDLRKDIINPDLTETAYENGVMNNYAINVINTLFGTMGKMLTDAIEEGNVGLQNEPSSALSDSAQATLSNLFNSGKLINNKFTSYNETSKYVYDKIVTITKLSKIVQKMNPQQTEIYDLVKSYRKNRISPLHKQLTQLLKLKQHVKSNGYVDGEKISLDFKGRKLKIQDIDKAIARLFALEYYEYQDLDKIIEQEYGKGLNLENFASELIGE